MWDMFLRSLAGCLQDAYRATPPGSGVAGIVAHLEKCMAAEGYGVRRVDGKIFASVSGPGVPGGSFTRELADVVIVRRSSPPSMVFLQVKNPSVSLRDLESGAKALEEIIASYDPSTGSTRYADKLQLAILSGLAERISYPNTHGTYDDICFNTFFACNELPTSRCRARHGYYYGRDTQGKNVRLKMPSGRAPLTVEYPPATLAVYTTRLGLDTGQVVLAMRAGDVLYTLAKHNYVMCRPVSIDSAAWSELTRVHGIEKPSVDTSTKLGRLNRVQPWRLRQLKKHTTRPLEDQLRLILAEWLLVPTDILPQGRQILSTVNQALQNGRLGHGDGIVLEIDYSQGGASYRLADLSIQKHLGSQAEYTIATEGEQETLIIEAP